MSNEFGSRLRELRIQAGISLVKLARSLGLSSPYLSDIERGNRNPPRKHISTIAEVLGLSDEEEAELARLSTPSVCPYCERPMRTTDD